MCDVVNWKREHTVKMKVKDLGWNQCVFAPPTVGFAFYFSLHLSMIYLACFPPPTGEAKRPYFDMIRPQVMYIHARAGHPSGSPSLKAALTFFYHSGHAFVMYT